MKRLLLSIFLLFPSLLLFSQASQTIRGKVVDKQSQYPLEGVSVVLVSSDPARGAMTDGKGEFRITEVPVGRHDIRVAMMGYKQFFLPNILVTSGKEVFVNIELEEEITQVEEVIIKTDESDKTKPNNENSVVSTRSFSIDETNRYAGSRNDPARMAMNFAGVTGTSDARNDIIIRGNSPLGVLWRMEGVDIPNPNHFGSFGTTGGPVSMLNNNVLSKSDFMTGAWPSQYGNALAGVFDLQMRKGNNEKREYMMQMGFNGLEVGVEGPFSKSKGYSYLANYRYSTLSIFKAIGISFGTSALPQYQDLNFKLFFPTQKHGTISIFGLGGISHVNVEGRKTDTTDLFSDPGNNTYFISRTGVLGISDMFFHNSNTYSKISLTFSGTGMEVDNDSLPRNASGDYTENPVPNYRNRYSQLKYSLNYTLNKKFNARNNLTSGIIMDLYRFNLADSMLLGPSFVTLRNFKGNSLLAQAYSTWQHRFSEKLTLNAGVHFQCFLYNQTSALEPRVGLKYQLTGKQSLSFGYGLHSQLQPLQAYFLEYRLPDGSYIKTNKDLKFSRSQQFVLSYDNNFSKDLRLKIETYYQHIYHVPVEQRSSSFSMLNSGADFVINTEDSLVNEGTGKNYGIEMTFEKFYSKGYYFLVTASLYNSKYKGSDGVERNTAFNGQHTLNILGGKEVKVKGKHALFGDIRFTWAGGRRFTPIDLSQSVITHKEVRIESRAFEKQFMDYIRLDAKVGFRVNGRKVTQELAFDVQNVLNRKNPFIQKYNVQQQKVIVVPQLGLFPVLQYRITF